MKYSLGLTAVSLAAITGLYIAGCSAPSDHGMGILDPYETSSPVSPGQPSTASPTSSPTPSAKGKELFQDGLTNPFDMLIADSMINDRIGYHNSQCIWTLQSDEKGGADTCLVRMAGDTEKGKSNTDQKTPHRMTIIDCDTKQEIELKDVSSMVAISNPAIKDHKGQSDRVFSEEYNPNQRYIVIADNIKSADGGRIIMVNINEEDNKDDQLYAKILYSSAKAPIKVAADNQFIWWVEGKADASVMRLKYIENPDEIGKHAYLCKVFTAGMNFPGNIISNGNEVFIADTGGGAVFVSPCFDKETENERSTQQVCEYGTDINRNRYKLTGFTQPYALTILENGKLLVADGYGNPLITNGKAPLDGNQGSLYIWDTEMDDGTGHRTLKTKKLIEGLNNPAEIEVIFDGSSDTSTKVANKVDVLIPQYASQEYNSKINLARIDVATNNSKLVKSKNIIETNRTTDILPFNVITSSDEIPAVFPEDQDAELNFIFNEGIKNPTIYSSVIQRYEKDYPF